MPTSEGSGGGGLGLQGNFRRFAQFANHVVAGLSAGRDEAVVRQKMVETFASSSAKWPPSGAVDVMIDIRGNFFYTRTGRASCGSSTAPRSRTTSAATRS